MTKETFEQTALRIAAEVGRQDTVTWMTDFATRLRAEWEKGAEPVAWVMQAHSDGSIGCEIAPVHYAMFDKRMAKLREHPWIQAGAASIVPLYASPPPAKEGYVMVPREPTDPMENWLMRPALEWLEQAEHLHDKERCKMIADLLRDLWRNQAAAPNAAPQESNDITGVRNSARPAVAAPKKNPGKRTSSPVAESQAPDTEQSLETGDAGVAPRQDAGAPEIHAAPQGKSERPVGISPAPEVAAPTTFYKMQTCMVELRQAVVNLERAFDVLMEELQ